MTAIPRLHDLVPHKPPMVLLDELVMAGEDDVHCRVTVREDGVFYDQVSSSVPAWIGIEMMAQAIAAWAGYLSWQKGEPAPIGFLLGTRRYETSVSEFPRGSTLDIFAKREQEAAGLSVFSCRIESDGKTTASCLLNVYRPGREQLDAMRPAT